MFRLTLKTKLLIWILIVSVFLMACGGTNVVATLAPQNLPVPETIEPETSPNPASAESTGTPDLSQAIYVDVGGTQVPTLDLTAVPVPEPPEYALVMSLPATEEDIMNISNDLEAQISSTGSFNFPALGCILPAVFYAGATLSSNRAAGIPCDKTAERLIKHLLDTSEKNRMVRLAGKTDFWQHFETLLTAMESGNLIPVGMVVADSAKKLGLLFQWNDPFRNQIRNILIIFTAEVWTSPTLIPIGEVKQYGPLAESMVHWLLKLADYNKDTGFTAGTIYLAEEAMRMLKGMMPTGVHRMTSAVQETFAQAARMIGGCMRRAAEKTPEYQEWKAKQPNGNGAPAQITLSYMSQEEALEAAKAITMIGITVLVIKIIVSAGTGQWYLVLVPIP